MKMRSFFASLVACTVVSLGSRAADNSADTKANVLTDAEKAAGWKLLFDGKSLDGWHGFKKKEAPKAGWIIEDGWLKCVANGHGGDLVSADEFDDFEFSWDWRIPAKANNGIK